VTEGGELGTVQADGDVGAVDFSPDGRTLASADGGRHLILWDVAKRTRLNTLAAHTAEVNDVAFSPDGSRLASTGSDDKAVIWKRGVQQPLSSVDLPSTGTPAAFSPDERMVAVNVNLNGAGPAVWDSARRAILATLPQPGTVIGFTSAHQVLLVGGGTVSTWTVPEGRRLATLGLKANAANPSKESNSPGSVALSPDGRKIAAATSDGKKIIIWDVRRDVQVGSLSAEEGVSSLALGRNGDVLAVGESGGRVVVWDVPHTKQLAVFPVETRGGAFVTVAISPDGHTVASLQPAGQAQTLSGCFGCDVILWSVDRKTSIATLSGHTVKPESVAFSEDGQVLATSGGAEIILWSVPQRARMATLAGGAGPLVFGPAGHLLATAAVDGSGRVSDTLLWDTAPSSWRSRLCMIVGRDLTRDEWNSYLPERQYQPVCSRRNGATNNQTVPSVTGSGGFPSASTSVPPATSRSSSAPQSSSVGVVDLSAVAGDSAAGDVARTLDTYFSSINKGDHDGALAMYDPTGALNPADPAQRDAFKRGLSTSHDTDIRIMNVAHETGSPSALSAAVRFKSTQEPGFGPASSPNETCTLWNVTYKLTESAPHEYRILRGSGSHESC